ncbi:MAG: type I-C CRISPR-associated endonuclease Cas1c [Oscillospiraceae bacterium]|nr:type I-C CRISPR-associated endonuclease Cas1c [Oscillospiraceae bacterium]
MRRLLNTLFVVSDDAYLSLEGENIVVQKDDGPARFPLHTLENILSFSYKGASPALMGKCAKDGIGLSFFTPTGRFLARTYGESRGNVLLRKEQYRRSDDLHSSCLIAKQFVTGKVYNSRWVLERATRDHPLRLDVQTVKYVSDLLARTLSDVAECDTLERLRGLEGESAARYFGVLDQLLLQNKDEFSFIGRSRRPPLDRFNALLSFIYALLANQCAAALEGVGLDSYVGFMHRDRAGRISLALDLMEEFRSILGDRLALTLINNRTVRPEHFELRENGAVLLTADGRKAVLAAWQERKREALTHPFLEEKLAWGLVPHVQALLLARYLRGDLDAYPPFLWK